MNNRQNMTKSWVQQAPYTQMLGQYRQSAEKLLCRLKLLQSELREMQMHKNGSAASALEQQKLEKRIMLLRTEYYEMTDCIREIGLYAEKEAQ